jgi:hypothetical protein
MVDLRRITPATVANETVKKPTSTLRCNTCLPGEGGVVPARKETDAERESTLLAAMAHREIKGDQS